MQQVTVGLGTCLLCQLQLQLSHKGTQLPGLLPLLFPPLNVLPCCGQDGLTLLQKASCSQAGPSCTQAAKRAADNVRCILAASQTQQDVASHRSLC
jgi:hypothetical protein